MTSGGKRPGAGRPAGSKNKVVETPRSPALRKMVALCAGSGMDTASISAALNVPEDELRADFAVELEFGGAIVQAEVLARLAIAARSGSAAAAKTLLAALADKSEPERSEAPDRGKRRPDLAERALRILDGGKK